MAGGGQAGVEANRGATKVVGRLNSLRRARAWAKWRSVTDDAVGFSEKHRRFRRLFGGRDIAAAFASWRRAAAASARSASTQRRVVQRLKSRRFAAAFTSWRETAAATQARPRSSSG